jgi:diphosphomevalonate decarboxylase
VAVNGAQVQAATARAYANIALCKYWGKRGSDNGPATPSISLALERLATHTTVSRINRKADQVILNGKPAGQADRARVVNYLNHWRAAGLLTGSVRIETENRFPTASGLASSASGYAALATALSVLAEHPLDAAELSRWARRGSGSAARSIPGGLACLEAGTNPAAQLLAPAEDVPWGMVLALVDAPPKGTSSRLGMPHTAETSPYYRAWLKTAAQHYDELRAALRAWDLATAGPLIEANALAMHACMLAAVPPLIYWAPATIAVLRELPRWRARGLHVYATIDAGPHLALVGRREDLRRITALARRVNGVIEAIPSNPGGPAVVC